MQIGEQMGNRAADSSDFSRTASHDFHSASSS
jgi:hypothetical protein